MWTKYDPNFEDIVFETPEEKALRLAGVTGGGGTTATPAPTQRPWQGVSGTDLRYNFRAGRLTESEWVAELVARGSSYEQALAEVNTQKATGVTATGKNAGQLTADEQAKVNAVLSSGPSAQPADPTYGGIQYPTQSAAAGGGGVASAGGTASAGGATGTASSSGGGGTGGGTSTPNPTAPKAVDPNSRAGLLKQGAIPVSGGLVLNGQLYEDRTKVAQAPDGQWYVVDSTTGNPVSGPYPNQTQAGQQANYTQLGPAVTGNNLSALPGMAILGANRPQITPGTGMDAPVSLDEIIAAGATRGAQPGDLMGAAQPWQTGLKKPLDITLGGIPDYGGLRPVMDAQGRPNSFTGKVDDNTAIGVGGGILSSVEGASNFSQPLAQDLLGKGIPANLVAKMSPEQLLTASQNANAMMQSGQWVDLQALGSQFGVGPNSDVKDMGSTPNAYETNLARIMAGLGTPLEQFELDYLPEYARGGSMLLDEPTFLVTASGKVKGLAGEAGTKERVTETDSGLRFDPTRQPQGQQAQSRGLMIDALTTPAARRYAIGGYARGGIIGPGQTTTGTSTPYVPPESATTGTTGFFQPPATGGFNDAGMWVGPLPGSSTTIRTEPFVSDIKLAQQAEEAAQKEALQLAERAVANAIAQAEEIRKRQFEAQRYGLAGMPAPTNVPLNFAGPDLAGAVSAYLAAGGNIGELMSKFPNLPTGVQWPVSTIQGDMGRGDREGRNGEGDQERRGWTGEDLSNYRQDRQRPPIGVLPGESPIPALPDSVAAPGTPLQRHIKAGRFKEAGRMLGMTEEEARRTYGAGMKPPLGAGLTAVA